MNDILSRFHDKSFWTSLVPGLRIEDRASFSDIKAWEVPGREETAFQALLDREGYVHMPGLQSPERARRLADAATRLVNAGIPAVFCMVFDEFWIPAFSLAKILKTALGAAYSMLPDFWVYHIDPALSERGWTPHREKGREALFPDGRPKSVSVWLALSAATPLNGCMYIVPADRDPTYGTEDDDKWTFKYPEVRALPAAAGDVFMWNQALLHWGAHASPRADEARISVAFEFQRNDVEPFNKPLLPPQAILGFADRLKLIGKQVIQYRHMYVLPPEMETVARALIGGAPNEAGR